MISVTYPRPSGAINISDTAGSNKLKNDDDMVPILRIECMNDQGERGGLWLEKGVV